MNDASAHSAFTRHFAPAGALSQDPQVVPVRSGPSQSTYDRIAAVRRSIAARADRKRVFKSELFSDPAWDMLLELYAASLAQRRLQVSRLVERTGVPATTVHRWIAVLEKEGLLIRESDRLDSRLVLLLLTESGRNAMDAYFDAHPAHTEIL